MNRVFSAAVLARFVFLGLRSVYTQRERERVQRKHERDRDF